MAHEDDTFEFVVCRILERMSEVGLTSNALSLAAGMQRDYVRGLQRGLEDPGKAGLPKHSTLRKLAGPLKCSIEYLVGGADTPGLLAVGRTPAAHRPRTKFLDQGLMLKVIVNVLAHVEQRAVAWSRSDIARNILVVYGKVSEGKEKERQQKLIAETENVFDIADRLGKIG